MDILVWRFCFPRSGPLCWFFCGFIESCGCFSKTLNKWFWALQCVRKRYCRYAVKIETFVSHARAKSIYTWFFFYAMKYLYSHRQAAAFVFHSSSFQVPLNKTQKQIYGNDCTYGKIQVDLSFQQQKKFALYVCMYLTSKKIYKTALKCCLYWVH